MPKKTARKPAAKRPRKHLSKRKKSDRAQLAVETALASLAHEIRTPLNGILALAELLAASDLGERERAWAAGVKSAAEHLARYTTIVTDAVRADVAGLALREDTFDPRRLAEAVGASLDARAQASGLNSEVAIAKNLPDRVTGDPVRLRAALENLIDNAVKFTARGIVRLSAASRPAARGKVRLVFAVTDSGIGLKPAEIKKLFRPFAQASVSVARRYGGTGLGLALVKRLGKAMGGDLTVKSKPGRGSTFELSVVVEKAQKPPAMGTSEDGGAVRATPSRSLNILCVEDNPYGRVVMSTILTEFGHRIEFAGTGAAAIAAVSRGGYDVVLMDVTLPDLDGIEVTRRIRALPGATARIPIIGISGHSRAEERKAARIAGMDDYLAKPVAPAALAAALAQVAR